MVNGLYMGLILIPKARVEIGSWLDQCGNASVAVLDIYDGSIVCRGFRVFGIINEYRLARSFCNKSLLL